MAYNRIGLATTEPFVSCDCVTIVDIVSFVRTSQKLPDDGLPNFFVNVDLIVNFAKLNSLQTQFFSAIAKLKTRSRIVLRKFSRNLSPAKIKENNVHTIHYNTTGLLTCPDWGFQYKFKISCKEQKIDL